MSPLLSNWREWGLQLDAAPRVVGRLQQGLTNTSWLLDAGSQKLVLRGQNPATKTLGIDRFREKLILEAAAELGIAPRVYYCDPEKDMLVTEYIDGIHWSHKDLATQESLLQLLTLVQCLQSLDVSLDPFDYCYHAEHYWRELRRRNIKISDKLCRQRDRLLPLLEGFSRLDNSSICHHDLVIDNIIVRDEQPYLLDWEYAGRGNHLLDLASLVHEWQLPQKTICDYFQVDHDELAFAEEVYLYFVDLWYLLKDSV